MGNRPFDIIDHFAGIAPGFPLDALRGERPESRENTRAGFAVLFEPATRDGFPLPNGLSWLYLP